MNDSISPISDDDQDDQYPPVPRKSCGTPRRGAEEKHSLRRDATQRAGCARLAGETAAEANARGTQGGHCGGAQAGGAGGGVHDGGNAKDSRPLTLKYMPVARHDLERIPRDIQRRILHKMEWYARQDDPLHFSKPLKHGDHGSHRFRIGAYRVLVDVKKSQSMMEVLAIRHRSEAYQL